MNRARKARLTESLTQEAQGTMALFPCVTSIVVILQVSGGLWVIIYRSAGGDKACVAGCLHVPSGHKAMAPHGHTPCGPPFLTIFYCPLLSLPPHASPCADPQDHNPLQLLLIFLCVCDLLPQVWKETLSAGVGRLGMPSPGWSERGHCVSKAEMTESPAPRNKGL